MGVLVGVGVTWKGVASSTGGRFWRRHSRRVSPAAAAPDGAFGLLNKLPTV